MTPTLVPFAGEWKERWDDFAAASRNGTVFHTRQFLAYHPKNRFVDASLVFLEGETIVGVLPAALKENDGKTLLVSHPGASYGGLVTAPDTSVSDTGAMLAALKTYVIAQNYSGISMLRLPPASLQRRYAEDMQYWLYQQGYALSRVEMDGAIDLRGLREETILPSLSGKCRNMVRQAERAGITVRLSNDIDVFWPILESVLTGRHGTKPTHTVEEMKKLMELMPGQFRLLVAYRGDTMVGGILLVTLHADALYTLYMAQEYSAQKDHPMHALLAEAMRLAVREKRSVLHLGVSTEDGGKTVNEGLFFFKESFGCRPVRRETWELHY